MSSPSVPVVCQPEKNLTEAEGQQWVAFLWSTFQIARQGVLSAHYAFAVERQRKQEWAYLLGQGSGNPNFKDGTFGVAAAQLPNLTQEPADQGDYRTPMFALFADIQQSCYNIQAVLPPEQWKNNYCPRAFLPVIDESTGLPATETNPITHAVTNKAQCVSIDGISMGSTQATTNAYQC
jgi:hypothetical protein